MIMSKRANNVVVIHNIISPHVTPLFDLLAKKVDLTVLYCSKTEKNRSWDHKPTNFKYKTLPNISVSIRGKDLFTYFINPTIISEIKKLSPDIVVIAGWDLFATQIAFLYCLIKGIKIILWSGSTAFEPSWRRKITLPLVKFIIKNVHAYIAYGTRAKEYLIKLGANPSKIFISFNTTDISKFISKPKPKILRNLKVKLGLKKNVLMYYGQFIERKGADLLLEAFSKVKKDLDDYTLLLVGDGDYRVFLESKIRDLNLKDVVIIPNVGDDNINMYYKIASVFVLPSREEVWGLVINQSMAAGLPVIVSDAAGSSVDLVKNGKNGFVFKSQNLNDLTTKIKDICTNKSMIKLMGNESKLYIKKFSPKKTVGDFLRAINYVLDGK